MISNLFEILYADTTCRTVFGYPTMRVFPWGRAPDKVQKPYAVYTTINGTPENYLDTTPDIDNIGTQVNIYADTSSSLASAFNAIREAVEPYAHMTNFATPDLDADTNLYSARMEFDFWKNR